MISNVAVIFGGRSCEHEISILSALQVMNALKDSYHIIPIYITKESEMYSDQSMIDIETFKSSEEMKKRWMCTLIRNKSEVYRKRIGLFNSMERIDFVIPVMHGLHGEDGSIQGYLEMLNVPYAGCDILASASCMSKIRTKQLLQYFNIPTLKFYEVNNNYKENQWVPCIIKPDQLGSSIGIQIVHEDYEWKEKVETALLFDEKCLVEPFIEDFDEINCSVRRKDGEIILSDLELVKKGEEILSFSDKYEQRSSGKVNNDRIIHPNLNEKCEKEIRKLAVEIYEKLNLNGIIRIDFMRINNKLYVNEINTIPGSYAFYLWEDDFKQLLESVMKESLFAYQQRECKIVSFDSNVLFQFNGSKVK